MKRKHGFRDQDESRMVFDELLPVVSTFADAIRKHLVYWQIHMNAGGTGHEEVTRVVLVGGNANIAVV